MGKDDNTGRLDPDDARLLARRPHGDGPGHEGDRHGRQPGDGRGADDAPPDALGRQLDGLELRLRLERHQPGVRRRPGRHVRERLGRAHEPRAGEQHRPEHLRPRRRCRRRPATRRRPCSAAARWRRCGPTRRRDSSPRPSSGSTSTTSSRSSTRRRPIRNAKTLVASKQPVGVPALPVFDQKQYTLANSWIKSYINVPLNQMTGYTNGIFKQHDRARARGLDAEHLPLARRRRSRRC